jgi:tetratricopeptide (TPR) repeat protein
VSARAQLVLAAILSTTLAPRAADACGWYTGTSITGQDKRFGMGADPCDWDGRVIACITDFSEHERRATMPLPERPGDDAPAVTRSDYAALLFYRGRVDEAIAMLEATEEVFPGVYAVAANLGTAYELAGRNQDALQWIREGIKRNPDSHDGTEWLHVKILEAKIALAADPKWLEKHSVLGLDFGDGKVPEIPTDWPDGQDLQSTRKALTYQLHERMGFVKPPDPIVADLLADLASLTAMEAVVEHSLPVFDLALAYKPVHAAAIQKRREALAGLIDKRLFWGKVRFYAIYGGVVVLIALLVVVIVLRRRRKKLQGLTAKLAATSGSVISAS